MTDPHATAIAKARYDRIAACFDGLECLVERRVKAWCSG
jgi:hypothetical protein